MPVAQVESSNQKQVESIQDYVVLDGCTGADMFFADPERKDGEALGTILGFVHSKLFPACLPVNDAKETFAKVCQALANCLGGSDPVVKTRSISASSFGLYAQDIAEAVCDDAGSSRALEESLLKRTLNVVGASTYLEDSSVNCSPEMMTQDIAGGVCDDAESMKAAEKVSNNQRIPHVDSSADLKSSSSACSFSTIAQDIAEAACDDARSMEEVQVDPSADLEGSSAISEIDESETSLDRNHYFLKVFHNGENIYFAPTYVETRAHHSAARFLAVEKKNSSFDLTVRQEKFVMNKFLVQQIVSKLQKSRAAPRHAVEK